MQIYIYKVSFFAGETTLHTVHIPNWFEKKVLRKSKFKCIYKGATSRGWVNKWSVAECQGAKPPSVSKRLQKHFTKMERVYWLAAKMKNVKTIVFP